MNEKVSQLPPGSFDEISPNDIFSQVMGPDKHGTVRMCGSGVAPSDVWGEMPSRSTSHRIMAEQKEKIMRLEEQAKEQAEQIRQQGEWLAEIRNSFHSSRSHIQSNESRATSSESNRQTHSTSNTNALRVNATISLFSIWDSNKVVAKARLKSLDPNGSVGRTLLGEDWCEVMVMEAFHRDEKLLRPYSILKTIGDVVGVPIAWPVALVRRVQDE